MSEQNQSLSLYDRYKKAVRSNPEAYVVVKDGDRLVTYKHECWLFAQTLRATPKKVNGRYQLTLNAEQARRLTQEFEFDLLEV